jgi:hypothetical protein
LERPPGSLEHLALQLFGASCRLPVLHLLCHRAEWPKSLFLRARNGCSTRGAGKNTTRCVSFSVRFPPTPALGQAATMRILLGHAVGGPIFHVTAVTSPSWGRLSY